MLINVKYLAYNRSGLKVTLNKYYKFQFSFFFLDFITVHLFNFTSIWELVHPCTLTPLPVCLSQKISLIGQTYQSHHHCGLKWQLNCFLCLQNILYLTNLYNAPYTSIDFLITVHFISKHVSYLYAALDPQIPRQILFIVLRGVFFLPRLAICAVTCGASWGLGTNVSSPKSIRFPTVGAGCAETGAGEDDAYKCEIIRMRHIYILEYQGIHRLFLSD